MENKVIGYYRAKGLMLQLDWKMTVTMDPARENIERIELYHPCQKHRYTVRRDSGKRLMAECRVCGRVNDDTAIMCYDHDGSDETKI